MLEWKSGKESGKKNPSWDLLSFFIDEGYRLGLTVHASTNVFVDGHNFFNRGVVYKDEPKRDWQTISYLSEGMVPITQQKKKYSAMLNLALEKVQAYVFSILKELIAMCSRLDGIIIDPVRYDGVTADFSDASRQMFENYIRKKSSELAGRYF